MKPALLFGVSVAYGVCGALLFRRVRTGQSLNRMMAHVMSFRLFIDEPRLIFRAQRDLIIENLRLLRQIAIPCAMMGLLFALPFRSMDRYFGHSPLRVGASTVISASGEIQLPPGIVMEAPPVRVPRLHQVFWRVHPTRKFGGNFPLGTEVHYPPTSVFGLPWLVWFMLLSAGTAAAIQYIRRMPN